MEDKEGKRKENRQQISQEREREKGKRKIQKGKKLIRKGGRGRYRREKS